ncbi:MAG: hypothetical protein ACTHK0_14890 [Ginsengibacter sp.]
MKKILFILITLVATDSLTAQPFLKGTNILSAGIGLGSSLGSYSRSSQTPALSLSYEKGVWDIGGPGVISLGAYAGRKSYKYSVSTYTEKWGYTIIGVRSAYHYNGIDNNKFDVYGGVMLSYNILNYSYKDESGNNINGGGNYGSGTGFTLYVGGRYFFSDNIAAFAELGYGVSYITL